MRQTLHRAGQLRAAGKRVYTLGQAGDLVCRELADGRGHDVVAVTFDPHPIAVLRPDHAPVTLTEIEFVPARSADDSSASGTPGTAR